MSAPHTSRTHASRVLLVADDPLAGKILAAQFTVQGHEVHWARDTMEARWLWLPKFYDVVVIDLQQDSASGLGFVRRIKAEYPDHYVRQRSRATETLREAAYSYSPREDRSQRLDHRNAEAVSRRVIDLLENGGSKFMAQAGEKLAHEGVNDQRPVNSDYGVWTSVL